MSLNKRAAKVFAIFSFLTFTAGTILALSRTASGDPVPAPQNSPQQSTNPPPQPQGQGGSTNSGQAPSQAQERQQRVACLVKAGISKDLMDTRRKILDQTRSQIESICGDSSLSTADKQAQVHQAREEARKQMDEAMTPAQQKGIESCVNGGTHPNAGLGPKDPCKGTGSGNDTNGNSKGSTPAPPAPSSYQ
jgi:hypothetical protein